MYYFLATGPVPSFSLGGQMYRLAAGDTLELPKELAEQVLSEAFIYHKRLQLISNTQDGVDQSISSVTPDQEVGFSQPETSGAEGAEDDQASKSDGEDVVLPEELLDADIHWSKVKAYLLNLEESLPIDYDLVEAIRLKFTRFSAVQHEAGRILATRPSV